MAEEIEGGCVICRRRVADLGFTCSSEPGRLRSLLAELPDLYASLLPETELATRYEARPTSLNGLLFEDDPAHREYLKRREEPTRTGVLHPAGPVRAVADGPRTSGGSVEAAVPVDLTVLDLTAPSRPAARALMARAALGLDDDQIGDLSVATTLETWCRDWRDNGWPTSPLPDPYVTTMCRWLSDRVDDACARHPAIDEFAQELRDLRGRLRGVAGYSDRPELVPGRCPRCRWKALYRLPGDGWIRCGNEEACGTLWAPEELCVTAA